jgi:hypothetical protein
MRLRVISCAIILVCGTAQGGVSDPPSRVARIRSVEGMTTVQDTHGGAIDAITRNWPLAPGDRVATQKESRAELDFGNVLLLLEPASQLDIEELKSDTTRLRIADGAAEIDASDSLNETISIPLANATIQISTPGTYRVEVRENGDARLIVHRGAAEVRASQAVFEQRNDEEVAIAHEGTFAIAPAIPRAHSDARHDRKAEGLRTAEHVAPSLVGYRDLDDYGAWRWIPEYGMVWEPLRVASDWAPYRSGRWIWKSPWGWTWVDESPWGFAPFHFGRWAHVESRWVWVPGPRQVPATYAPGLVHWMQAPGEHDSVGWYPLAPGEEYTPPYPATERYKRGVNLFAVVSSGRVFSQAVAGDRSSPAGLTWASRATFARHPSPDLGAATRLAGE